MAVRGNLIGIVREARIALSPFCHSREGWNLLSSPVCLSEQREESRYRSPSLFVILAKVGTYPPTTSLRGVKLACPEPVEGKQSAVGQ